MAEVNFHPAPESRPVTVRSILPGIAKIKNPDFNNPWRGADLPSPTIVKSGPPVVLALDGSRRELTANECSLIASFGPRYCWTGSIAKRIERIGNSVPPLLMRAVASRVRELIGRSSHVRTVPAKSDYLSILEAAWQDHLKPREPDAPTVISTFAGGGGSSLGYSMAGYRELLAVEWDDNAVATFRLNFPDVPVFHGDIAKLSVEDCLSRAGIKPGELDVFDGSPPCQGFSTASKRDFGDERNQLFREYVRLLRGLRPKAFVMENVSGMVKGKMKLIFAEILRELKASGYRVRARLLNAMYFNVPQSRERMIFVGIRDDLEIEPGHPKGESIPTGCIRLDGRPAKYSDRRYGDTLERPGSPVGTITKIGRKFWSRQEEFGPRSYVACGSFPSEYRWAGNLGDIKNRIGNSVPPLLMRAVAGHVRKILSV